jgi:hypothetical protein
VSALLALALLIVITAAVPAAAQGLVEDPALKPFRERIGYSYAPCRAREGFNVECTVWVRKHHPYPVVSAPEFIHDCWYSDPDDPDPFPRRNSSLHAFILKNSGEGFWAAGSSGICQAWTLPDGRRVWPSCMSQTWPTAHPNGYGPSDAGCFYDLTDGGS